MSEIRPQIIYSPEGELVINTDLREDLDQSSAEMQELMLREKYDHLTVMSQQSGVAVKEFHNGIELRVALAERFSDSFSADSNHEDLTNFLKQLNKLLPLHSKDQVDKVFSVEHLFWGGGGGIVHEHFQRWLNTGLTEEAGRHSAMAMALPFGHEVMKEVEDDFCYRALEGQGAEANAFSSRIVVANQPFGLYKTSESPDTHFETTGNVMWGSLIISTLGNCACWGVMGSDRENVHLDGSSKRLYSMDPHNIDNAKQSLSILLGVSSLAYFASLYEGREDILAEAEWGETRDYPIK